MKLLLVFLSFFLSFCSPIYAQDNPFAGGWEFTGLPPDADISLQKYFDDHGGFYNIRRVAKDFVKTHYGKYEVKSDKEYWEYIAKDTAPFMAWASGKTSHINYKFSEDKKLLTLWGDAVPGSSAWRETWKRIDVPKFAVISKHKQKSFVGR